MEGRAPKDEWVIHKGVAWRPSGGGGPAQGLKKIWVGWGKRLVDLMGLPPLPTMENATLPKQLPIIFWCFAPVRCLHGGRGVRNPLPFI